MIELSTVSARGPAQRGRPRPVLSNVSLEARRGVLAIVGAPKDGTSLLFDVLDGTVTPRSGRVAVDGGAAEKAHGRVARVSLEAPLPDALRVDEVCDLAADLRSEPRRPARERLDRLGVGALAPRRVRSLSVEERRTVALSLALTSSKVDVLLVEEPLLWLDPVAPSLVVEALRGRAERACVIVTTASPRDAMRIGDGLAVLTGGAYTPLWPEHALLPYGAAGATMRIVVSSARGKEGARALVSALSGEQAVSHVESSAFTQSGCAVVVAAGPDPALLAKIVTRAIAATRVDVELVEPSVLALDPLREALQTALAARSAVAASPPPGGTP